MRGLRKRALCMLLIFAFVCSTFAMGMSFISPQVAYAAGTFSLFVGKDASAAIQMPQGSGLDVYSFWDSAVDSDGNIYTLEQSAERRIWKYTLSTAQWSIISLGNVGTPNNPTNSPGKFNEPTSMTMDSNNNLYVVDSGNHRIQKYVPSTGQWSVVSLGLGASVGQFHFDYYIYNTPGINSDSSGNLYVADYYNHRVQKYTASTGQWSVLTAGTGQAPSYITSSSSEYSQGIYYPSNAAVDASGNIYITDSNGCRVSKLNIATGQFTFVGSEYSTPSYRPVQDLIVAGDDNLYISNRYTVLKYSPSTNVTTVFMNSADPVAGVDKIGGTKFFGFDNNGNLLISDIERYAGAMYGIKKYTILPSSAKSLSATLGAGALTLVSPTLATFDSVTIDGTTKNVTLSATGGKITDATGSGSGWTLKVSATRFANSTRLLSRGSFALTTVPSLTYFEPNSSNTSTVSVVSPNGGVDQVTPLTVFTAAASGGMGTYNIADHEFTLTMAPKETFAGVYITTITYTLAPSV